MGEVEQLVGLYALVPSWHACVLGPVPIGSAERLCVRLDHIVQPGEVEALAAVHHQLREVCRAGGHEYDPSEWDLVHVVPVNCN